MSIRIALTNAPEFYTNLDIITGKIILGINRPEQVGAVIVKLEGESKTALGTPNGVQEDLGQRRRPSDNGQLLHENHKILYKVQQVFPDENTPAYSVSVILQPGQYEWPFRFKVPFNNGCSDPAAMAKIGGLTSGFAGPSLFGLGGIRVMDGSKQLMYTHVTKTLPPSFTGFPREAEIRYYIKVTIQRPGLFKENWRYQTGLKFLPIEPPRPTPSNQEAYARRPFAFKQRSPSPQPHKASRRQSIFGHRSNTGQASGTLSVDSATDSKTKAPAEQQAPSIEISARLPYPSILTCNKPLPLRLIAKKLAPASQDCYLVSLQVDLIGSTIVRCQDLINTETTRWVVFSRTGLSVPLQKAPDDPVGTETAIDSVLWSSAPLPNTVMPSFVTCNLSRSYQLEIKFGVCWGKPSTTSSSSTFKLGKAKQAVPNMAQTIYLPLHFSSIEVYSGLTPPESLVRAVREAQAQQQQGQKHRPSPRPHAAAQSVPALPTRPQQQQQQPQSHNPLYPPQLRPGQTPIQAQVAGEAAGGFAAADSGPVEALAPPYDEAPPSYDEAMADTTGPIIPSGEARPAYSGVTNENAPDSLGEKN